MSSLDILVVGSQGDTINPGEFQPPAVLKLFVSSGEIVMYEQSTHCRPVFVRAQKWMRDRLWLGWWLLLLWYG
jgi:hypothetical protein